MKARTRWVAGLAAAAILLATTVTAFGYTGQVEAIAGIAVRGTVTCDKPFTLVATIQDANGAPVVGLSVNWSWVSRPSTADTINKTPTVTDAKGEATTTVSLAPVNGDRKIRANAGEVGASIVVTQVCGGLPRTSTLPDDAPAGIPVGFGLFLVLGGLVGGTLALRRRA